MRSVGFTVSPGWRILLKDMEIDPANVLRRARLPDDFLTHGAVSLPTDEWFRLWRGLEAEANDPLLPLRIGRAISFETFDPPVFAAMCSRDLNVALDRISFYKKLCAPLSLDVRHLPDETTVAFEWLDASVDPPASTMLTELVFFVQLARIGTRAAVHPRRVVSPVVPDQTTEYTKYFGVFVQPGKKPMLAFSAADARRPFLTANDELWSFFEPRLRVRLSEIESSASVSERVRAALLELLPSGDPSIESVCRKLGISKRSLQRRLREEHATYQTLLNETRAELASHYLSHSELSGYEISFLLGYENPSSFFRAFHSWTGKTPEQVRARAST